MTRYLYVCMDCGTEYREEQVGESEAGWAISHGLCDRCHRRRVRRPYLDTVTLVGFFLVFGLTVRWALS